MAFYTKLDQVADLLRERIIAGEFERGQKLKQVDIANELGVSVTPVREALKVLEMEGYIVSAPHKGLSVPEVDAAGALESYELRMVLERRLTAKALDRITPQDVAELRKLHDAFLELAKKQETLGVRAANVRFHFKLYAIADQPQTLQFVRVLWAKYPFNFAHQQQERLVHMTAEHDAIMTRIEAGDREGVLRALDEHITTGWKRVARIGGFPGVDF